MSLVTHNIGRLNNTMALYQRERGLSTEEMLSVGGAKVGREIYFQLRNIAPKKGAIREQLTARLKSGRGIKIRDSVKQKNETKMIRYWVKRFGYRPGRKVRSDVKVLNAQNELLKREIGARESARLFLSVSAKYPPKHMENRAAVSRYGTVLSQSRIKIAGEGGYAQFRWDGLNKQGKGALTGISKPKGQRAIGKALNMVNADMMVYVRRKQSGVVSKTIKTVVAPRQVSTSGLSIEQEIRRVMAGKV